MTRFLAALSLFLLSSIARAEVPPEATTQNNMMGFIGFGAVFVLLCVGFVWIVIWSDKKQKAKPPQE